MTGHSRQRTVKVLTGRWRIAEMDLWEQDSIDRVAPGFVEFGEDHRGSLGLIAVRGGSTGAWLPAMVSRAWRSRGNAVMRAILDGRGWAAVEGGGSLRGRIYFHLGDYSGFRAERTGASRSRGRTYGS